MKRSLLIAIGMALGLVLWIASGQIGAGPEEAPETAAERLRANGEHVATVRVRELIAEPVAREVVAHGQTAPARAVTLRAEVAGRVAELGPERGERVAEGELIVRLDPREREQALDEAKAHLAQREIEDNAARQLGERGFQAETRVAEARALLEQARAAVRRAEVALEDTHLRAPFAGVLERRPVELGDFVDTGHEVATVIEQDPFLVVADIPETQVGTLENGMTGAAELISGRLVEGRVRYIATEADPATRTFRVELEVPNPEGRFDAGMSARLRLELEPVPAHRVSAALLTLADDGRLGIKAVDDDGVVRFHQARIVRAESDHVWLGGLPERLRIITVGQGFVRPGERVRAVEDDAEGVS